MGMGVDDQFELKVKLTQHGKSLWAGDLMDQVQANKQFDWAIYPDKNHSIRGGTTRVHLFTKMTNFIKENL